MGAGRNELIAGHRKEEMALTQGTFGTEYASPKLPADVPVDSAET